MKKFITILFVLLYYYNLNAGNISRISNPDLYSIYTLSFKNLNFSSPVPEDSIIKICSSLEHEYNSKENQDTLFWIEQIAVNALCLKGDIGLAINKANIMFENAKEKKNKLGLGLSLQAIGNTYMHSNQLKQAYESYNEAEKEIENLDVPFAKSRLYIQLMHICMELNDMQQLQKNIYKTIECSEKIEGELKNDIIFYISCYQTLYQIGLKEKGLAYEHLKKTLEIKFPHHLYDIWCYYISSRYYELIDDYPQASLYCDSVIQCLGKRNINAFINFSIQQADLYEKQNELDKACSIYANMNSLSDSLNITKYSSQIDSLHVIYWIDQMKVENAAAFNQMLTKIMIYSIVALVIIVILISFAKKKNKQLIESQKKLSEIRYEAADSIQSKSLFLSNMSHELRTPLNAIVGFSGLLADNGASDPALKQQCADVIKQNSELLLKLINDIVDLSDLKENNFKFVWGQSDVVVLCRSVVETVGRVKQTSAVILFNTNFEHLVLNTDQGRLQQVLINLLVNATKFTSKGTITLSLDLSPEQDMAIFSVEDTGCGIPLEKQPHIFKRFEKLHEGVQGAGLGLSICQLIVEHVGGKIWIDSSYTKGAKFIFTHPIKNIHSEVSKK